MLNFANHHNLGIPVSVREGHHFTMGEVSCHKEWLHGTLPTWLCVSVRHIIHEQPSFQVICINPQILYVQTCQTVSSLLTASTEKGSKVTP